jgi:hypothetical protein
MEKKLSPIEDVEYIWSFVRKKHPNLYNTDKVTFKQWSDSVEDILKFQAKKDANEAIEFATWMYLNCTLSNRPSYFWYNGGGQLYSISNLYEL